MSTAIKPAAEMGSPEALRALYRALSPRRRRQAFGSIALMLVGALAEVVSVGTNSSRMFNVLPTS